MWRHFLSNLTDGHQRYAIQFTLHISNLLWAGDEIKNSLEKILQLTKALVKR